MHICNRLSDYLGRNHYYVPQNDSAKAVLRPESGQNGFRIPTVEQWEWMTRARSVTNYFHGKQLGSTGKHSIDLTDFGWFAENQPRGIESHFELSGRKWPNPWGLFDVYGNVFELVYSGVDNKYHVAGGGVFLASPKCDSAYSVPVTTTQICGLRPVCPYESN